MNLIDLGKIRYNWTGPYNAATAYELNDCVSFGGSAYVFIFPTLTAGIPVANVAYWSLMVQGWTFMGAYSSTATYQLGNTVAYGSYLYVAMQVTTGNTPAIGANWALFNTGVSAKGTYNASTNYLPNDIVQYGANLYLSLTAGVGVLPTNPANWLLYLSGVRSAGIYAAATQYHLNDIVSYGANSFIALQDSLGNVPTNVTYWTPLNTGVRSVGTWVTATAYYPGDIAIVGNINYICLVANTSGVFAADLASGDWLKFTASLNFRGLYAPGTLYNTNDIVSDGVNAQIAITTFTSGTTVALDGPTKWSLYTRGTPPQNAPVTINSATTLVPNTTYLVDTSLGSFPLTFWANPNVDDVCTIIDAKGTFGVNPPQLLNPGLNIMGIAGGLSLNISNLSMNWVYVNAAIGFKGY